MCLDLYGHISCTSDQGCGVLIVCRTAIATPGLDLGLQLTSTPPCIVWHTDCVLKDDWRENLNFSYKRCTIAYNGVQAKFSRSTYPDSESPSKGRLRLQAKTRIRGTRLGLHTPASDGADDKKIVTSVPSGGRKQLIGHEWMNKQIN